jgi:hypothetical protein
MKRDRFGQIPRLAEMSISLSVAGSVIKYLCLFLLVAPGRLLLKVKDLRSLQGVVRKACDCGSFIFLEQRF